MPPIEPDGDPSGIVRWWESRVRRVLLGAHVLPAVFGLVAVLGDGSQTRPLDVAVWALVLAWTMFLLAFGWSRAGSSARLSRWVIADALVMACLMFVGTPARSVASYVAVDGALFAAAFVSARLSVAQVAIVYSGLALAALALAHGSTVPTPIGGWQTPVIVTFAGILALRFLRHALDRLDVALNGRASASREERELLAGAAQEGAITRDVTALETELEPALGHLEALAVGYRRISAGTAAEAEARWLADCCALSLRELASLKHVMRVSGLERVEEVIDSAILGASAAQLIGRKVQRHIDPTLADAPLDAATALGVAGFVREAVTNALFHGATPIAVDVTHHDDGRVAICVRDAGRGYDPAAVAWGLGLEAMDRHAEEASGEILFAGVGAHGGHEVVLAIGAPA